jgi:hypothetical protein
LILCGGVLIAGLPVAGGGLRLKKAGELFILVVIMGEAFYEQEHKLLDLVSGRF